MLGQGDICHMSQMNSLQVDTNGRSLYIDPNENAFQIQVKIIDSRYYTYASFDRERKGKDKEDIEVKCSGNEGKHCLIYLTANPIYNRLQTEIKIIINNRNEKICINILILVLIRS
jgi:hypothetical protein